MHASIRIVGLGAAFTIGLGLLAQPSPSQALSCLIPQIHDSKLIVEGKVKRVRHLSSRVIKPWPFDKNVRVRSYEAEVVTLAALRGRNAPQTFTYTFRQPSVDCDASLTVKPGETALFSFHPNVAGGKPGVRGHSRAMYRNADLLEGPGRP